MLRNFLLSLISLYRRLWGSWFPPRCRFFPSCSIYAQEALQKYPTHKAILRICWRLMRCQPFHAGGVDLP